MEFQQFYSCMPCALVYVFNKWTIGTYDAEKLDTRYCLFSNECKPLEFVLYFTSQNHSGIQVGGGREGERGRKGERDNGTEKGSCSYHFVCV